MFAEKRAMVCTVDGIIIPRAQPSMGSSSAQFPLPLSLKKVKSNWNDTYQSAILNTRFIANIFKVSFE